MALEEFIATVVGKADMFGDSWRKKNNDSQEEYPLVIDDEEDPDYGVRRWTEYFVDFLENGGEL